MKKKKTEEVDAEQERKETIQTVGSIGEIKNKINERKTGDASGGKRLSLIDKIRRPQGDLIGYLLARIAIIVYKNCTTIIRRLHERIWFRDTATNHFPIDSDI